MLLLKHRKLGFWVQPGGHVEGRETPDEAAVREAREETGLEVEIVEPYMPTTDFDGSEDLPQPFNVNLHPITEDHYHCDFQYLCRVTEKTEEDPEYESEDVDWFSAEELDGVEMPENARITALRALEAAD